MGVMECDRKGCNNIMCKKHSSKYGYICEECFNELCASKLPIHIFMYTNKQAKLEYNYENEFKEK